MTQHDWVFIVTIPLTEKEAREALGGKTIWFGKLDPESAAVRHSVLLCHTCEQTITEELLSAPCPGEPRGYDVEGNPWWN